MRAIRALLACACFAVLPSVVAAQTSMRQQAKPSGWGARTVLLPILATHGGLNAACSPRAAQLAARSVDQIDRFIAPTPPQRAYLEELKAALRKATDLANGSCPNPIPQNLASATRLYGAAAWFSTRGCQNRERGLRHVLCIIE
jgi:hypothetical protein